jgi:hypothetical protein
VAGDKYQRLPRPRGQGLSLLDPGAPAPAAALSARERRSSAAVAAAAAAAAAGGDADGGESDAAMVARLQAFMQRFTRTLVDSLYPGAPYERRRVARGRRGRGVGGGEGSYLYRNFALHKVPLLNPFSLSPPTNPLRDP